jgi:hypothetical protein
VSFIAQPHVVYHVAGMGNWKEVVPEQLSLLVDTSLKDIRIIHLGEDREWLEKEIRRHGLDARIILSDPNLHHCETLAMIEVERLAKEERTDRPILYMHTKGVSNPGDMGKRKWRVLMEEAVVRQWRENVLHLERHDAVGVNWLEHGEQHFSGTFWIARPDWIRRLPNFRAYHSARGMNRYSCEMWIGAAQWCRAKSLVCSNQPFWHGGYNFDQWLDGRREIVTGRSEYRGTPMQQHQDVTKVWPKLLAELRPARILEIGTGPGGHVRLLRNAMDDLGLSNCPVWSLDATSRPEHAQATADGAVVRLLKPFGPAHQRTDPLVRHFIRAEGTTLILCDGPNVPKEFAAACRVAKVGDIVCGHDYAPNSVAFREKLAGRVWNWLEFTDTDAAPVVAEYAMERWAEEDLSPVVWAGWRKGREAAEPQKPVASVSVIIPAIPPRRHMLLRALESVDAQTVSPDEILWRMDRDRQGPVAMRNAMLKEAKSEWVAFLDDDDEMYPTHLEDLLAHAQVTGADYVFSYFDIRDADGAVRNELDTLGLFGKPFDPTKPHQTTITTLVKTELARRIGFKEVEPGLSIDGQKHGEDFQFTLDCVAAGAKIVHLPKRTWVYSWHGANTSGEPGRWQ